MKPSSSVPAARAAESSSCSVLSSSFTTAGRISTPCDEGDCAMSSSFCFSPAR